MLNPIRSSTWIWVVTRHQYGISALVSQTSFRGKCRLFSQDSFVDGKCCFIMSFTLFESL